MTRLEETLVSHRRAVGRRYFSLIVKYLAAAAILSLLVYVTSERIPFAAATAFALCAFGWIYVDQEAAYECKYVMPDSWFAEIAAIKSMNKETLRRIQEMVRSSTPVTLHDIERIAEGDREICMIMETIKRPGVRALLSRN